MNLELAMSKERIYEQPSLKVRLLYDKLLVFGTHNAKSFAEQENPLCHYGADLIYHYIPKNVSLYNRLGKWRFAEIGRFSRKGYAETDVVAAEKEVFLTYSNDEVKPIYFLHEDGRLFLRSKTVDQIAEALDERRIPLQEAAIEWLKDIGGVYSAFDEVISLRKKKIKSRKELYRRVDAYSKGRLMKSLRWGKYFLQKKIENDLKRS